MSLFPPTPVISPEGIPYVNTGRVHLAGNIWKAMWDTEADSFAREVTASCTMGWLAKDVADYDRPAPVTIVCITTGAAAARVYQVIQDGTLEDIGSTYAAGVGFPYCSTPVRKLPAALTSATADTPGFMFLQRNTGSPYLVRTITVPVEDTTTRSIVVAWNNELDAEEEDMRLVDISTEGPAIIVRGPSSITPGDDAIYVRVLGGIAAGLATELTVNLRPSETLVPDLLKMHCVGLEDGTVMVYYRVVDEETSFEGTAMMAFRPSATSPSAYGADNVTLKPTFLVQGYVPDDSHNGICAHPITGEILMALQATSDDDPGEQVYWAATRGRGTKLDPTMMLWDADTHPHLYGGRWRNAAPTSDVRINSIGWSGERAGAPFVVVGEHIINDLEVAFKDFNNVFDRADSQQMEARRLCMGELWAFPLKGEAGAEGSASLVDIGTVPLLMDESLRPGYDIDTDLLDAQGYWRMDDVEGNTLNAVVGPNGTIDGYVPAPGHVTGALQANLDADSIEIPQTGEFDNNEITLMFWVYAGAKSAVPATRSVVYKTTNGANAALIFYIAETINRFNFTYRMVGAGGLSNSFGPNPLEYERWYHIVGVFKSDNTMQAYVNGVLHNDVANAGLGGIEHLNPNVELYLGKDPGGINAARHRIDDLVWGNNPITHAEALHEFVKTFNPTTGPLVQGPCVDYVDRVVGTMLNQSQGEDRDPIMVCARELCITPGSAYFESHLVYDVWRLENEDDPEYIGTFSSGPECNTFSGGNTCNPLFASEEQRLDSKVFVDGTVLTLFTGAHTELGNRIVIHRIDWDMSTPEVAPTYTLVMQETVSGILEATYGMDVIEVTLGGSRQYVILMGTYDPGVFSRLHVIRPSDYGATVLATAPTVDFANLLPAVADNLGDLDWNVDVAASLCFLGGIVAREITAGMGFDSSLHGDVQIIYGIATLGGGANGADPGLMGTATAVLDLGDIDAGNPPTVNAGPAGLDEYGWGGVEPFFPLRWLSDPSFEDATADTFILGLSGMRDVRWSPAKGNHGLTVFRIKREGTWSVRPVLSVPLVHTMHACLHGADMMWRDIAEDPAVFADFGLLISRPWAGSQDAVSSFSESNTAAVDEGWAIVGGGGAVNSLIRNSSGMCSAVYTEFVVQSRAHRVAETRPRLLTSGKNRAMPILRWALPGEWDTPELGTAYDVTPSTLVLNAYQGAGFSTAERLSRFFSGDTTLHAGIGSNEPRTPRQTALSASLGTIGTGNTEVEPVGVLDDGTHGIYVFVQYGASGPATVKAYLSSYTAEMGAGSTVTLWTIPFSLRTDIYRSMRVVLVGGAIYLYYAVAGTGSSTIYSVSLDKTAPYAAGGSVVSSVNFRVLDRMYAVPNEDTGRVTLYLGDEDDVLSFRTVALVHAPGPGLDVLVREPKEVYNGAAPFPQSYAACQSYAQNNVLTTVAILEPSISDDGGGAVDYLSVTDKAKTDATRESGNAWIVANFAEDGYWYQDSLLVDYDSVVPYFGGHHASDFGGKNKVRVKPLSLDLIGGSSYNVLAGAYLADWEPTNDDFKFPQRLGANVSFRSHFGENFLSAQVNPLTAEPTFTGTASARNTRPLLVAGSLHYEPAGGVEDGDTGNFYNTIGGVANQLDSWRLTDAANATGATNGSAQPRPIYDAVHGVKGHVHDADKLFIVGWVWHPQ